MGKLDDEFVRKTFRDQVDDILLKKSPIELKYFFKDIQEERKVILIDGAPGSGSMLTVHICRRWELFEEFTAVIFVQLRDPKVQSAHTILADLLPQEDPTMAECAAARIIVNKSSGILWILDGWDKLSTHLQKDYH